MAYNSPRDQLGAELGNGAIVVAYRHFETKELAPDVTLDDYIILCVRPTNLHEPYVTWRAFWSKEEGFNSTTWGHYFHYFEDAAKDFNERLENDSRQD